MRILRQSGPLVLALGVALTGCSPSANTPQSVSTAPAKKGSGALTLDVVPASSQVALRVEGMS
jgi:hypothetical protein